MKREHEVLARIRTVLVKLDVLGGAIGITVERNAERRREWERRYGAQASSRRTALVDDLFSHPVWAAQDEVACADR
jgi:hypothetical protein